MITRVNYEVPVIKALVLADDKSNVKDFFIADVHGGRKFLLNDGGYPMNDIDMILRQQDASVRDSLLKNLEEVPTSGVPADTPNEEVLLSLRSRYQQTPSEMVKWYERQLEIHQSKMEYQSEKPDTIKFDNPDPVDNV